MTQFLRLRPIAMPGSRLHPCQNILSEPLNTALSLSCGGRHGWKAGITQCNDCALPSGWWLNFTTSVKASLNTHIAGVRLDAGSLPRGLSRTADSFTEAILLDKKTLESLWLIEPFVVPVADFSIRLLLKSQVCNVYNRISMNVIEISHLTSVCGCTKSKRENSHPTPIFNTHTKNKHLLKTDWLQKSSLFFSSLIFYHLPNSHSF